MRSLTRALALIAVIAAMPQAQTNPLGMATMQAVKDMGLGINLGNTFEAVIECEQGDQGCVDWVNGMETLETSWGSPTITEAMIKGYATAGIKTVRIPVAWSNKMTGNNYTVSAALLDRVEEVVGYVLDNGMYAIVNIHWDGGWWKNFPTDSAECMKKYKRIWTQVSDKFKDHSGYLIFESLNEEGVWQDVWNQYDNTGNKTRAYNMLNAINQEFTTLVRASGGNNAERHLLIAGYATNIDRTIDDMFKMPTDPKNRQAVSVHYYDPFGFTHLEKDESWATMAMTWGTQAEIDKLNAEMDKMKTNFVDKGIPVIVGEYGFASNLARAQSEIRKYTLAVAEAIYERDMCPVLWDINRNGRHDYYNRGAATWTDPLLVAGFKAIANGEDAPIEENSSSSGGGGSSSSGGGDISPVRSIAIASGQIRIQAISNNIALENLPSNAKVEIYNLHGKRVYSSAFAGAQLIAPVQAKGMYIVKIGKSAFRIPVM